MVDEPVALRRKYRAENGLVAVRHSGSKCKIPPSKINRIFHLIDATRKEERGKFIALARSLRRQAFTCRKVAFERRDKFIHDGEVCRLSFCCNSTFILFTTCSLSRGQKGLDVFSATHHKFFRRKEP